VCCTECQVFHHVFKPLEYLTAGNAPKTKWVSFLESFTLEVVVRARRGGAIGMATLVGEDGEVMACAYVPRSQRGTVASSACLE
jgi:hypothetical protein